MSMKLCSDTKWTRARWQPTYYQLVSEVSNKTDNIWSKWLKRESLNLENKRNNESFIIFDSLYMRGDLFLKIFMIKIVSILKWI